MAEMTEGQALLGTLARDGRLTPDDVGAIEAGLRQHAQSLGYGNAEIDAYFGRREPEMTPVRDFFAGLYRDVVGDDESQSVIEAWRAGFQQSVTGLTINGKPPELTLRDNAPMVSRIAFQSGAFTGDFPFMVAGALAGGGAAAVAGQAGPQALLPEEVVTVPAGAMAGAFALPAGLRTTLMQMYQEGSIDSFGEFWDRTAAVALDTAKAATTGFATGKAGDVVKGPAAKLTAELATMVTVGAALDGRVPEPHEFIDGAVMLFGAKGATKAAGALRDVYAKTGKSPVQVADDARADPRLPDDLMAKNMDVPRAYRDAADGAQGRVMERVSVGAEEAGPPKTFARLYQSAVDDLHGLGQAVKAMAEGRDVPVAENAYLQARLFRGVNGKADHFVEFSPFKYGTYENVGKPLKAILEPVKNDLDGLRAYAVSRRAEELRARGIETGVAQADAAAVVRDGGAKYGKIFDDLVAYQEHTLNYLRDSGVVSPEMVAAMREANRDYVPFFRVIEGEGPKGTGKGMQAGQPIRRIKGSEKQIIDPLESIIKNTYTFVNLAERNAIGRALVDLAEKSPNGDAFVKKVATPTKPVTVTEGEIAKLLEGYEKGLGVKLAPEELTIFRPNAMSPRENQIAVYRDGKRSIYEVAPEIAETFKGLDVESANAVVRLLSVPAKVLRAGSVLSPEFIARNPIRDQLSAFIFSESGFKPFLDLGRGVWSLARKDADYQAWLKSGGPMATLVSLDRTYLQKSIRDVAGQTGFMDAARNVVTSPLEVLRLLSDFAEQGTRIGEFKRATGGARSKEALQAGGMASREITLDFARIGAKTRAVNSLVAFFNASVQGTDKAVRAFKARPVQTTAKIAASITMPSVLLHLLNRTEEGYYDLPQWQRDLFWPVKVGDTWYRIPKPFELGIIFGTGAERMVDAILDGDPKAFDGFLTTMGRGMSPGMVPTVAVPIIETFANRSLFTDRPIIPADREGMLPEYQYSPYTSELTKGMGMIIGRLPLVGDTRAASPAVIDTYIRGWTGGVGVHLVNLADKALREAGALPDPVTPAATLADVPFVKAFVIRHPTAGAEPIQRFYDRYFEHKRAETTVSKLMTEGEFDNALAVLSGQNGALVDLDGIRQALSQSMRFVRLVYKNPAIPRDEKRQLIDGAYSQMIDIARHGNALMDVVDEMKARK